MCRAESFCDRDRRSRQIHADAVDDVSVGHREDVDRFGDADILQLDGLGTKRRTADPLRAEASRQHERARGLLASEDFSNATLEAMRVASGAYERALNAKSMQELEQVWLLPEDSLYRTRWKSKFSRPEELEVSVEILSIDKSGKQVRVVFNQREATPQRTRTWKYEALLIKRSSTDEWQIVENKVKR